MEKPLEVAQAGSESRVGSVGVTQHSGRSSASQAHGAQTGSHPEPPGGRGRGNGTAGPASISVPSVVRMAVLQLATHTYSTELLPHVPGTSQPCPWVGAPSELLREPAPGPLLKNGWGTAAPASLRGNPRWLPSPT